jgi:Ni/Fe-hydrogenase subunit HybB-like protein
MSAAPDSKLGSFSWGRLDEDILATLGKPGRVYLGLLLLCFGLMCFGAVSLVHLVTTGIGVFGLNQPVSWGVDITDFVFWVGIGHAGTLISAVLFLLRVPWRTAIFRTAEAATIFAVLTAGMFPLLHVGRVWVDYYLIPYPSGRELWVNFRSPLVWDAVAITTYLTVSSIFFFVGLLPDIAAARDRAEPGPRKTALRLLSLGWLGSLRQWKHYLAAYVLFAGLATPLVVSVHSVVSWDFAMSSTPGWHTTIFAPYFVAGAILSGLAMVITILVPLRRALRIEHIVRPYHFESMAKLLLVTSLVVGYAYGIEYFVTWYQGNPFEVEVFRYRPTGDYAPIFWLMVICNAVVPLAIFSKRVRSSIGCLFLISLLVNVGMWCERFNIIASSLSRSFMPATWRTYTPTWVEVGLTAGSFGFFFLLLLSFVRILPAVSMAEVKESMPRPTRPEPAPPVEALTAAAEPGGAP